MKMNPKFEMLLFEKIKTQDFVFVQIPFLFYFFYFILALGLWK